MFLIIFLSVILPLTLLNSLEKNSHIGSSSSTLGLALKKKHEHHEFKWISESSLTAKLG